MKKTIKFMAIDFYMNGLRARKHQASGTKITEDGKYVEKEYMENGVLKKFNPIIEICKNGLRRILNKKLGFLYIQDLVMECFGSPKPADGQDWVIAHLDGNMQNDHYKNLAWKLRKDAYPHTAVPKKMLIKLLIICFSVSYEDISMRRILKWMYCANFAQTFKMSQYVPNSLRVQSVVTIHR
jgi:hypothetical protein